jgi:2-polyprenyl-3-methyl-5-hydroxy-6-metoxy-1,4-benzoquinol methylase
MAQEDGFDCIHYDPFFHPDESVFEKKYDFITCSETAEHFRDPAKEFNRLATLLEPGGVLGVMTSMHDSNTDFANWHYRHDPTHVAFYSEKTFNLLVDRFTFRQCDHPAKNVALLTRKAAIPVGVPPLGGPT